MPGLAGLAHIPRLFGTNAGKDHNDCPLQKLLAPELGQVGLGVLGACASETGRK